MQTSEILEIEKNNTDSIYLFKEGIFWRCYELSALYFIKNIKEYRVFRKFVKTVNQDIVYLGFPNTIIEEIIQKAKSNNYLVSKNEKRIVIIGIQKEEGFEKWKENIKISGKENKAGNMDNNNQIIQKIKEFDLINKTPVESFNFLSEIQKQLVNNQ